MAKRRATRGLIPAIASALLWAGPARGGGNESVTDAGTILQYVLPVAAGGAALVQGDWKGLEQFGFSFTTTMAVVYGTKYLTDQYRPDDSTGDSYPSGHTASAFSGAAFINHRYGWEYGLPSFAAAAFVGYSRIQANRHYLDDVVAGASIALLSDCAWVFPLSDDIALAPLAAPGAVGIAVRSVNGSVPASAAPERDRGFAPRFRFEFEFGPTWEIKNEVTVPPGLGTTIDLNRYFDGDSHPAPAPRASLEFFAGGGHELMALIAPSDSGWVSGKLGAVTWFADKMFLFGPDIRFEHQCNVYQFRYCYRPDWSEDWTFKAGLAAAFYNVKVQIRDQEQDASVNELSALPLLYLHLGYCFAPGLEVFAEASGMSASRDQALDATCKVRYRLSARWDLAAGYRFQQVALDSEDIRSDYRTSSFALSIGYSF